MSQNIEVKKKTKKFTGVSSFEGLYKPRSRRELIAERVKIAKDAKRERESN
jgi:hypothetical protein